jgi:serine/threonine-protein kinase RsbT
MSSKHEPEISVSEEADIVAARRAAREIAVKLGFNITNVTRIVTVTSALARNIFLHAGSGVVRLNTLHIGNRSGLELRFEDNGPGIADLDKATTMGYTNGGGLPGVKRLMDEMEVQSEVGKGTTVMVRKWLERR